MISKHSILSIAATLAAAVLLTACGGSSDSAPKAVKYNGLTTPAAFSGLTASQQEVVVIDTFDAAMVAANLADDEFFSEFLDTPSGIAASGTLSHAQRDKIVTRVLNTAQQYYHPEFMNIPVAATQSFELDLSDMCDSGSAKMKMTFNDANNSGSMTLTYKNCRENYGSGYFSTNGQVTVKYSNNNIEMTFKNYSTIENDDGDVSSSTINGYYKITGLAFGEYSGEGQVYSAEWNLRGTENGKAVAMSGTLTCTETGCTLGSVFTTGSGKTYRVENLEISTNDDEWLVVEATLYHPQYGSYEITLVVDNVCDANDPSPFTGEATLISLDAVITYSSVSCQNDPVISLNVD